jgi:hypothetical protein
MEHGQRGSRGKDAGSQDAEALPDTREAGKASTVSHWGQGSASALETLRNRDYRGRRSKPADERPAAE